MLEQKMLNDELVEVRKYGGHCNGFIKQVLGNGGAGNNVFVWWFRGDG